MKASKVISSKAMCIVCVDDVLYYTVLGMDAELTRIREVSLQCLGRNTRPSGWSFLHFYIAYSLQELSGLTLSDVEGVWQGVESQLTLRLRLIEELSERLAVVERERAEQVSRIHHVQRAHWLWLTMLHRHVSVCTPIPTC